MVKQMNRQEWVAELSARIASLTVDFKATESDSERRMIRRQIAVTRKNLNMVLQVNATFA